MLDLCRGRYRARFATTDADLDAALDLRSLCFRGGWASDADGFDTVCRHVLVQDGTTAELVCTFRLLALPSGAGIGRSYAAQFYGLSGLATVEAPMLEMGRFCIHPARRDPDVLRVAWGAIAALVAAGETQILFGCTSFPGTDPRAYAETFGLLGQRYRAPDRWRPGPKAPELVRFASLAERETDPRAAMRAMPALLRSYLAMGGWVSDHAVVDRDLGTLHVLTGLEIAAIPAARRRQLMRLGGVA